MNNEELLNVGEIETIITQQRLQIEWLQAENKKKDEAILKATIEKNELQCAYQENSKQLKTFKVKLKRRESFCQHLDISSVQNKTECEYWKQQANIMTKTIENLKTMLQENATEKQQIHEENIKYKAEFLVWNQYKKKMQENTSFIQEKTNFVAALLKTLKEEQVHFFKKNDGDAMNKLLQEKCDLQTLLTQRNEEIYHVEKKYCYAKAMNEELKLRIDELIAMNNDDFYRDKWRQNIKDSQEVIEKLNNHINILTMKLKENSNNTEANTSMQIGPDRI